MTVKTLTIPDIGSDASVEVVEVSVKSGDVVEQNQLLIVVESDKASVEIPSDFAGTVNSVDVAEGDFVKQGDAFLTLKTDTSDQDSQADAPTPSNEQAEPVREATPPTPTPSVARPDTAPSANTSGVVYAGPAVRKQARELGVDLSQVPATGVRNRITKEDVDAYVRQRLSEGAQASLPAVPEVDFAEFGEISTQKLNGVKRATAKAMTAAWLNIPHVTHFDEADITELEAFRKEKNALYTEQGIKFSVVPFVLNALSRALKEFPTFNASLNADGESLTLKKYLHIGVAVDTPKGLLVPAVRNVDALSIVEITRQLNEKAGLARDGKLPLTDMKGATFTLSSLGGIGGTAFTPIVNAPEVAILGLSRAVMKPRWNGEVFEPRLMLPLSLSYDHRVIDGAEAARFSKHVVELLQDNTCWPM